MEPTCTTTQEAEMTTLEILKQTREQYYTMTLKAGEKYLKALALKGEILPWEICGEYPRPQRRNREPGSRRRDATHKRTTPALPQVRRTDDSDRQMR